MSSNKKRPQLSVTKLAEYVQATPLRRRAIVKMAKRPMTFIVRRYELARFFAKEFFKAKFDKGVLDLGIKKIKDSKGKGNPDMPVESLERLKAMSFSELDIQDLTIHDYQGSNPKLKYSGIAVSVYPDLVLRGTTSRGKKVVGVVKFHFSSSFRLSDETSINACVMLHEFTERFIVETGEEVARDLCLLVDPFAGTVSTAPSAVTRRLNTITVACEEVSFWWRAC
jgi:hypothetical protein